MRQHTSEKSGPSLLYLPIRWAKGALRSPCSLLFLKSYNTLHVVRLIYSGPGWKGGALSAILWTIPNWRVSDWHTEGQGSLSEEPGQAGEMGWLEPHEVQLKPVWSPAAGSKITSCSATGWGPTGQKATWQEMTCRPWSTRRFIMSQQWELTAKTRHIQAVLARV